MADRSDKLFSPQDTKDRLNSLVEGLVTKTNLKKDTIRDLLEKGWSFHQELGKTDRWMGPMDRVRFGDYEI